MYIYVPLQKLDCSGSKVKDLNLLENIQKKMY